MTAPSTRPALRALAERVGEFCRQTAGQSGAIVALFLVLLIVIAAFVIDIGHAMWVRSILQSQVDSAALSAGQYVAAGTAQAQACHMSGVKTMSTGPCNGVSGENANSTAPVNLIAVNQKCFASLSVKLPCVSVLIDGVKTPVNGVVVTEQSAVPTIFARVVGLKTITVTATATASRAGGSMKAYNIVMILDTTDSMNGSDSQCAGGTRIACARAGLQTLLSQLSPSSDYVGLVAFPPVTNASAAADYTCTGAAPSIEGRYGGGVSTTTTGTAQNGTTTTVTRSINPAGPLSATPVTAGPLAAAITITTVTTTRQAGKVVSTSTTSEPADYQVMPLQVGYSSVVNGVNKIIPSSPWGIASGANSGSGCAGIRAIGGVGTFYADAIIEAQSQLAAFSALGSNPGATNVIILLSDGEANATATNMPSTSNGVDGVSSQCNEAIAAAAYAKAHGTLIYTIGYGAGMQNSCVTDKTGGTTTYGGASWSNVANITACATLQNIATSPDRFYSDKANGCVSTANPNLTTLQSIFNAVGESLASPRLYPNDIT